MFWPQQSSLAVGEFIDTGIPFLGVDYSAADWGDYDNDGDLDLALVGEADDTPSFKLYANQGNETFLQIPTSIPGRTYANLGWVDYNDDGQLDLLVGGNLTRIGPGGVITLYRNEKGSLVEVPNTPFLLASYPAFDWGDYDHDGDLDLLLAGRVNINNGTNFAQVYRNNGDETFSTLTTTLAGVAWGSVSWVDYDTDGQLDIFLTGCPDGGICIQGSAKLYRNIGNGEWIEVATPFIQVGRSGADWADYDNDGDLDVMLIGSYQPGRLYRNLGKGTFQDTGLNFPPLNQATVRWADYDADGWIDLSIAGLNEQSVVGETYIYHNLGNGNFAALTTGITGIANGGLAWGDYNGDSRLDLLVTGCTGVYCTGFTRLYRNTLSGATPTPIHTTTPTPPPPTSTPTPSATPLPTATPSTTVSACALYPIALHSVSLNGVAANTLISDIYNGSQPGQFGWLTWAGDQSTRALATSLNPPGNSCTYTNPNAPNDHTLSVGDWVASRPGVSNVRTIQRALENLKAIDIVVPVWDMAQHNGQNTQYRIVAFASVRLTDYHLAGTNRISATFLGYVQPQE